MRDAPEKRGRQGIPAAVPEDDQVGVLRVRECDDRVDGLAGDPLQGVGDTCSLGGLGRRIEGSLRLVDLLAVRDRDRSHPAGPELVRLRHVDEGHVGALLFGQLEADVDRLPRGGRAVGCDQDLLHELLLCTRPVEGRRRFAAGHRGIPASSSAEFCG